MDDDVGVPPLLGNLLHDYWCSLYSYYAMENDGNHMEILL